MYKYLFKLIAPIIIKTIWYFIIFLPHFGPRRDITHTKYRKMWVSVLLGYVSSCFISSNLKDHWAFINMGKQCNKNYMPSDRATHPRRTESSAAMMWAPTFLQPFLRWHIWYRRNVRARYTTHKKSGYERGVYTGVIVRRQTMAETCDEITRKILSSIFLHSHTKINLATSSQVNRTPKKKCSLTKKVTHGRRLNPFSAKLNCGLILEPLLIIHQQNLLCIYFPGGRHLWMR